MLRNLTFLCLTVLLCAATFNAQQNEPPTGRERPLPSLAKEGTCVVTETRADGDLIVNCAGVEYRAVGADHARRLIQEKAERERLAALVPLLEEKITVLERDNSLRAKDVQLADLQRELANQRAENFRVMYEGERALRVQAESFMKRGRVTAFFDKPVVQLALRLGIPVVGTILSAAK
jgi:hypothetical protein